MGGVLEFANPAWLWALLGVPLLVIARLRGGVAESRPRRLIGAALRALAVTALLLLMAGPLGGRQTALNDVLFLLDSSSSVGDVSTTSGLDFVNRAFAAKVPRSRMGLAVFAADATLEQALSRDPPPIDRLSTEVERSGTDIGRALQLAMGSFASDGQRRIVLLSDGQENLGSAHAAALVARSIGVEVFTVTLPRPEKGREIRLEGIDAPAQVRANEPFRVQLTLQSDVSTRSELVVLRNGSLLRSQHVNLTAGFNTFSFVDQVGDAGLHEYEAILNSDNDQEQANNRYQTFVRVRGEPRVLHAVGQSADAQPVTQALSSQALQVDELPANALPANEHELAQYDLVILNNVSGFDLSLNKMELLHDYVRDAGGGVIMLGGDRSFAAGGYLATPVERLLPVTMDVKSEVKIPSLAVLFVLDRSGSMGSRTHGEEKLSIAKSAALSSIEILNRLDRVGVLAFDSGFEWAVPLTEVGQRQPIIERLRRLETGGGTDLHQALTEALRAMRAERAKVKHLIVLSDGLTEGSADFDALARSMSESQITVSTVAMGVDADRDLMQRLASLGRGRHYFTDDPRNVPRIFISETMVVARELMVEGKVQPRLMYPGEPLKGLEDTQLPLLEGYQRAFPKPAAQVLVGAAGDDPLLVSWRYGLGKSVAFMSDLSSRWGQHWIRWPNFPRWLAQTSRWTMRSNARETMHAQFTWQGRRGQVTVDVLDHDERFVNGLKLRGALRDPLRKPHELVLAQIAPGRYRGEFPISGSGRYFMTLSEGQSNQALVPRTFGFAVPYSPEYRNLGVNQSLLTHLAESTGGKSLPMSDDALAAVTAPPGNAVDNRYRIWWPFVLLCLIALLLELMVRKLNSAGLRRVSWLRHQGSMTAAQEGEPSVQAMHERIRRAREQHLAALKDGTMLDPSEPSVRARLYLARRRDGR